jgi:hypothetical protein
LSRFSIIDSVISFATTGVNLANAVSGAGAIVALTSSTVSYNATALLSSSASILVTSKTTFFANNLVFGSAGIASPGDNVLFSNTLTGTTPGVSALM